MVSRSNNLEEVGLLAQPMIEIDNLLRRIAEYPEISGVDWAAAREGQETDVTP